MRVGAESGLVAGLPRSCRDAAAALLVEWRLSVAAGAGLFALKAGHG